MKLIITHTCWGTWSAL